MTLGEKLQTLRRSRGLSQEQLAEILEVSRQAVSKWENGESAPDLDRLRAICTYFGVTTDYLIWDEPEDAPRGAEEARSREAQKKPLRETVREHSEWAGYAAAILGAAMLLRAAGHDPADAPAWKQYCAGRGNESAGAVGAFVDVSAVPCGLRARHCRRAAAGPLAEKEKGST